jgi:hypothetical protein
LLTLEFSKPQISPIDIKVYDMLGNLVLKTSNVKLQTLNLDLSGSAKGVYMLECVSKDGVVMRRVVVCSCLY